MNNREQEFIEKVIIYLDNKKDVEVIDFITSVAGFQKEYKRVVEENGFKYNDNDIKLYIKVKEGSLIWEFIRIHAETYAQQTMDFLAENVKNKLLKKTCDYIGNIFKETQNEENIENKYDKNHLENAKNILTPAKKDLSSRIRIKHEYQDSDKTIKTEFEYEVNGATGRGIYDKLSEVIEQMQPKQNTDFTNEVLILCISDKNSVNGVIENLSDKEVKLICSEEIRNQMIKDNQQNPFNMFYIVNGEIKKVGDKVVAYQIKHIVEKGLIEEKHVKELT